jgi:hypothetical protein
MTVVLFPSKVGKPIKMKLFHFIVFSIVTKPKLIKTKTIFLIHQKYSLKNSIQILYDFLGETKCPATHNSVSRSELFRGVVIYNVFTYVDIVFLLLQKLCNI